MLSEREELKCLAQNPQIGDIQENIKCSTKGKLVYKYGASLFIFPTLGCENVAISTNCSRM